MCELSSGLWKGKGIVHTKGSSTAQLLLQPCPKSQVSKSSGWDPGRAPSPSVLARSVSEGGYLPCAERQDHGQRPKGEAARAVLYVFENQPAWGRHAHHVARVGLKRLEMTSGKSPN